MRMPSRLIDRTDCCLVIIDVQQYFLDKLPPAWRRPLVARIAWLMRVATALDIPIVATAEDIGSNGPLLDELEKDLPHGKHVHDKLVFGLAGQPAILDNVKHTGRKTCVLAGLKTDVCIAHSTLGLLDEGFRVAVIEDATASPPPHHEAGLRRIAAAGGIVTTMKGIHYEWVRDLATLSALRQNTGTALPDGLDL